MFRISWCVFWNMAQRLSSFSMAHMEPPRIRDSFKEIKGWDSGMKEGNKQIQFGFFEAERHTGESWLGGRRYWPVWNTLMSKEKKWCWRTAGRRGEGPRKYKCRIFGIKSGAKWWSWYLVWHTKVFLGGNAGVSPAIPGEVGQQP